MLPMKTHFFSGPWPMTLLITSSPRCFVATPGEVGNPRAPRDAIEVLPAQLYSTKRRGSDEMDDDFLPMVVESDESFLKKTRKMKIRIF